MEHLGVELHGPNTLLLRTPEGSVLHILGRTYHLEIVGDGGDGVAMAHPHLRASVEALEERIVEVDGLEVGTTVLTAIGLLDLSAKAVRDELGAVADAQHRNLADKLAQIDLERLGIVDRIR